MKTYLQLTAFIICGNFAMAQPPDAENAIIQNATREFRFVVGNAEHPVQINEETVRQYTCKNYRTDIPIAEFYDDMETMDDINIWIDGDRRKNFKPTCDYYQSDGIFYSDARICHFNLSIIKKGSVSKVEIKKTHLDPRYFNNIFFMTALPTENFQVKLIVPSWMEVEVKEFNFKPHNVVKTVSTENGETVYNYSAKNIPSYGHESASPGITHYAPHILVLSKSAKPKNVNYTYFKTVKEQYLWYKNLVDQVGNDEALIKAKTVEIIGAAKTDEEKVKKIFQWVQDNIRYIAFENGIAGFKPAKAQDVLLKKYGDCKGMANLLTVMLQSIKLDARRCWIGTRQIAYDYSMPSLAVDNHMICAWMNKGKPVFLDATEKYIGFGEIAERIQGRQTLIENGDQYLIEKVPQVSYLQNTAIENRKLVIDGNNFKGHVQQIWKGENKEWLLTQLNEIKQDKQENALRQFLAKGNSGYEINNLKIENLADYNADLKVEYDVLWKDAISSFGKESYVEINNRRSLSDFEIDTAKRKLSYLFPFKDDLIFETEIQLSKDKQASTLPENVTINQPGYSFLVSCKAVADKIIYKSQIIFKKTELAATDFPQWNKDVKQLTNSYNQQIVLTQKQ